MVTTAIPYFRRNILLDTFLQRNFFLFWLGQFLSTLGDQFTLVALAVYVFQLSGSAMQVGMLFISTALPTLFIGPIVGPLVDRWDHRRTMIVADLLRLIIVASIPLLVSHNLAWVYILSMLSATFGRFHHPAKLTLIPDIVPQERLMTANSIDQTSMTLAQLLGYAAAGLAVAAFGAPLAFYVDAMSFLVSASMMSLVIVVVQPRPSKPLALRGIVQELGDGLKVIQSKPLLRGTIILSALAPIAVGAVNAGLVVFALRTLNSTSFGYSLMEASQALGLVIGGVFLGRYGAQLPRGQLLALGAAAMGVLFIATGLSPNLSVALAVLFLIGMANMAISLALRTIVHESTPREVRGRVFAVLSTASYGAQLIGAALAGISDVVDVRWLLIGAGVYLAFIGWGTRCAPAFRSKPHPIPQTSSALRPGAG